MDLKPGQLCVFCQIEFIAASGRPSWSHIAISKDNTGEWAGDKMNIGQFALYLGTAEGHYPEDWVECANGRDCDCLVLTNEKLYFVDHRALAPLKGKE